MPKIPFAVLMTTLALAGCTSETPDTTSQPARDNAEVTQASAGHAPAGYVVGSHDDWCGGHGVPESQCTRCNPALIPAFKATNDWCAGHQLPESQCLKCNPGLTIERAPKAGAASAGHAPAGYVVGSHDDWCGGHGVPESQCTRCNPALIPAFKATNDWCAGHQLPESQCLKCNPGLTIERAPKAGTASAGHAPAGYVVGSHDDWCGGHGVPESQCTRCNPALIPAFKATNDWCAGHQLPESQCLKCNPGLKIERPPSKHE